MGIFIGERERERASACKEIELIFLDASRKEEGKKRGKSLVFTLPSLLLE